MDKPGRVWEQEHMWDSSDNLVSNKGATSTTSNKCKAFWKLVIVNLAKAGNNFLFLLFESKKQKKKQPPTNEHNQATKYETLAAGDVWPLCDIFFSVIMCWKICHTYIMYNILQSPDKLNGQVTLVLLKCWANV